MKISKTHLALMSAFLLITLLSRWLPHPPNMTAVGALALMSGALWGRRLWAPLVPLAVLFVSDLILGFHSTFVWVYAGFVLVALTGAGLRPQQPVGAGMGPRHWGRAALGAGLASLIFFAISNFGVWMAGGLYPRTGAGLIECYVMALPFLGNQLAGDFAFTAVFTLMARRALAPAPAPQAA